MPGLGWKSLLAWGLVFLSILLHPYWLAPGLYHWLTNPASGLSVGEPSIKHSTDDLPKEPFENSDKISGLAFRGELLHIHINWHPALGPQESIHTPL